MNPDSAKYPHDHKSGIWWRRWSGTFAVVSLFIIGALGFAKVEEEGHTREKQFCQLVLHGYKEHRTAIVQTQNYLASPQGKEPTGLNEFIRDISLPKTEREVKAEEKTLPDVCMKYDKK
jgi:hypothetical protein